MPTIITKVISGKSATRTDYISRTNLHAALEGQGRGLYGATINDLRRGRGTRYLRGANHINEVFDLIISPGNPETFTGLGASAEEREANLKSAVRAGMAELESSLGLELRWLATRHQNRLHQHLHILLSEEGTRPDGTTQRLRHFPRHLMALEENGNSALGNIFLRQFEERALRPLGAMPTRENPELATRYPWHATLANADGALNFLTEEQGLTPAVVTAAAAAGTIRATEASQPVFVRRDATGLATGAVWQEPGENFARRQGRGWFYQGNLTTATRFLLVDTPDEALALQSLHPDRDLSRVAVLALNPGRLDEELVTLLVNRQRAAQAAGHETVRVVWARGHKTARQPDGSEGQAQNLHGLYELNTRLQEEAAAQGLPALTVRNYAPQQAQAIPELNFAAWARPTWLATLNHLRFTAELTHYYTRLRDYAAPAAQSTSDLQVSLEQGHLGAQPTPSRITLPAAEEIADGTRRLAAEAEALTAQRAALVAERALALATQPALAQSAIKQPALAQSTPEQASGIVDPDAEARPLTWREETDALRALPLEAVALQAGYWRLQQLGEEIWTDDPAARNHSIKITGDRFYDRTLGLGGRGALNFAAHLNDFAANSKEGFTQARRWLAERFAASEGNGNFVPLTEPAQPRLERQPLLLPQPAELPANVERMRHYLEETRGLSAATVAQARDNGSLYANEWGNPFFVWRDAAGQSVGGQWRSALPGDNRRDQAKGSWKEAGWFYLGDLQSASHYVLVESPLEALSYQDIALAAGHDLSGTAIVSLAGTTTPPALLRLLHERQAELAANNEENPFSVALGLAAGRAGELGFNRFVAAWSAQFTGEEEFPVAVALADQPDEAQLAEAEETPPFNPLDAVQWLAAPAGHWNAELLAARAAPHYPDLAEIATLLEDAADDPTNVTAAEFAAAAQLEVTADAREPTEALLPETPLQPTPAALPEFTPATAPVTVERNPRPAGSVPQVEAAAPDTSAWTEVKRQAVQLRPALTEAGTNNILAPAQALTWLSGRDPAGDWRAVAFGALAATDPTAGRQTKFVDWSFAGGGASRHEALRGVSLELKSWLEESAIPGHEHAELYQQASARLGKLAAFWQQSHERELAAAATEKAPVSAPAAQATPNQPEATPLQPEIASSVPQAGLARPDAPESVPSQKTTPDAPESPEIALPLPPDERDTPVHPAPADQEYAAYAAAGEQQQAHPAWRLDEAVWVRGQQWQQQLVTQEMLAVAADRLAQLESRARLSAKLKDERESLTASSALWTQQIAESHFFRDESSLYWGREYRQEVLRALHAGEITAAERETLKTQPALHDDIARWETAQAEQAGRREPGARPENWDAPLQQLGLSARRQDGRDLNEAQRLEVRQVVAEVSAALGQDITPLLKQNNVQIWHLNGESPDRHDYGAQGILHVGATDAESNVPLPTFAKDFALYLQTQTKGLLTYERVGAGAATDAALTKLLQQRMNWQPADELSATLAAEEAQREAGLRRLGPQPHDPDQLWARLLEQHIGQVAPGAKPLSAGQNYEPRAGYLDAGWFAVIQPALREGLELRVQLAAAAAQVELPEYGPADFARLVEVNRPAEAHDTEAQSAPETANVTPADQPPQSAQESATPLSDTPGARVSTAGQAAFEFLEQHGLSRLLGAGEQTSLILRQPEQAGGATLTVEQLRREDTSDEYPYRVEFIRAGRGGAVSNFFALNTEGELQLLHSRTGSAEYTGPAAETFTTAYFAELGKTFRAGKAKLETVLVDGVERRAEFAFTPPETRVPAEKQVETATESQPETDPAVATEFQPATESPLTTPRRLQAPAEQSGQAEKNVARLLHDLGLADYVLAGEDFYAKVENQPYLDLVIEGHAAGNGLQNLILTHYVKQGGDLIHDGEMIYALGPGGHLRLAETAPSALGPWGDRRGLDRSFAGMFARNLRAQGFGQGRLARLEVDGEERLREWQERVAPTLSGQKARLKEAQTAENALLETAENAPESAITAQMTPEVTTKPAPETSVAPAITATAKAAPAIPADPTPAATVETDLSVPAEPVLTTRAESTAAETAEPGPTVSATAESSSTAPATPAEPAPSAEVEPISAPDITDVAPDFAALAPPAPKPDNYRLTDDTLHDTGLKTKFKNNIAALKTLQDLEATGRDASPAEMETLARFSGWGGLKPVFAAHYYQAYPNIYQEKKDVAQEWGKEATELANLVTPEEFRAAEQSAENAHYTAPEFAREMWRMAQKLGFNGGHVLEPAAGSGNIIGVLPDELRERTRFSAVEKDPLTARLAARLYPRAQVQASGFETARLADNSVDLLLTNVPFGSFSVADPKYDKLRPSIHDYFFLKGLDKLKPGGLLIALTSRYTLDRGNAKIRGQLAEQGHLLQAFRLPETAFSKNAHTAVVTDLLIMQKKAFRDEPTPAYALRPEQWVGAEKTEFANQQGVTFHEYLNDHFRAHPENIWGELSGAGQMYAGSAVTVKDTGDWAGKAALARAALPAILDAAASKDRGLADAEVPEPLWADLAREKSGNYVLREGEFYQVQADGQLAPHQWPSAAVAAQAEELLALRDTLRELYAHELADDKAAAGEWRERLNEQYDAFYAQHGAVTAAGALLAGDPDRFLLAGLEQTDPATQRAHKADVFHEATISGYTQPERAETLSQALAISLNETGRVDLARLGTLLSLDEPGVTGELTRSQAAFENHAQPGEWLTGEEYLSGPVREKLRAVTALQGISLAQEERWARNAAALAAVQPRDLDYVEIEANLGAPWIAPEYVKGFALHLTGAAPDTLRVEYNSHGGQWRVSWDDRVGGKRARQKDAATKVWGVAGTDYDALRIMQAALDGRPIRINHKGTDELRPAETEEANSKLAEMKREFKDWLWQDAERRQTLHRAYNDKFNDTAPRRFDGSHLTLPGLNPAIQPRPHQLDGVWRAMQEGDGTVGVYYGHEVGTGKTITYGMALMEKKRLGQLRKPVLAVKKANIRQITEELQRLYPASRVFSGAAGLDAKTRPAAIADIAANNYDLVILTYEQLDRIPFKPETHRAYLGQEMAQLDATIRDAEMEHGSRSKLVSRLNKRRETLAVELTRIANKPKDTALTFEETGIDYIAVDEGHSMKSLPVYTTMQGLKGIPTTRSQRATNMHLRAEYLREKHGQVRLMLGSGTPITNTVAESYNLLRFIAPTALTRRGVGSFDAFAKTFTESVEKMEPGVTGEYKAQTRLAKFINVPELRALLGQGLDVVRAQETGIIRPVAEHVVISVPPSAAQLRFRQALRQRSEALSDPHNEIPPSEDNHLMILNDGRLMSLDLRLAAAEADDHPGSKVNVLVANVARIMAEHPGGTQAVFSDLGVHGKEGKLSVYDDIEAKLIARGVPPERIANFNRVNSEAQRAKAVEALNSGAALVALGSTDKLGTGVNAQQFMVAYHNLDVPWLPSSVEQRRGRAERQGNVWAELAEARVTRYDYVTTGSFDEIGWGTIDRKQTFINQLITNDLGDQRSFHEPDAEDLGAAAIAAIASGNPDVMRRVELSEEIERLERAAKRHRQTQLALADQLPYLEQSLAAKQQRVANLRADHALYQAGRAALGASPEAIKEDNWQSLGESTGERLARLKSESQASLFAPDSEARRESAVEPDKAAEQTAGAGKFDDKRDFAAVAAELTALEEQRENAPVVENEAGLNSGATGKNRKEKWAITLEGVVIHDKDRAALIIDQALAAVRPLEEKIVGNYLGFDLKVAAIRSNFGNSFKPQLSFHNPERPETSIHVLRATDGAEVFPTINPYLGRLGQEANNLERQLAPQQQEVTTLRENVTRPFRFAADLAASRLELTAVQGRLREWNAAAAALQEQNGSMSVRLIKTTAADPAAQEAQLTQGLDTHLAGVLVTPPAFVSAAHSEALIRGVPLAAAQTLRRARGADFNISLDDEDRDEVLAVNLLDEAVPAKKPKRATRATKTAAPAVAVTNGAAPNALGVTATNGNAPPPITLAATNGNAPAAPGIAATNGFGSANSENVTPARASDSYQQTSLFDAPETPEAIDSAINVAAIIPQSATATVSEPVVIAPPPKPVPVSAIVRQAAAGFSAQAETDAVQRGALLAGATPYAQEGERLTAGLLASRLDGIVNEESKLPAALVLEAQVALLHDSPALTLSPAALAHHVGQAVQDEIAESSGETQDLIATAEADNRNAVRADAAANVEALAARWEQSEAAGPEPEAQAGNANGKERQALNEATQLLLLQAGDRELYQQFFTAPANAKLPPTSAWHRGRVLAQEALARLAVKEARAAEVEFELNYERAAFPVPPEVTRLAPAAFNRLSEAGQPAGEVPAEATTPVQWSLTAVKTAQETWAQARLVAETLAAEATGQQTAAKERLNQTLQTLLTPQSPAAQIRQHFLGEIPGTAPGDAQLSLTQGLLNHANPARRLEFHPLAQIAKGIYAELQAGKDAARIQAEIAAKESALAAIGEAVQAAAQAERQRRARLTVQAGDKHEFVKDEADSLRMSGLSVLEDPVFVGEERELSGARALRIGDAEGVREYQLATLREAKRLDYLTKNLGGMAAALGWNPAHPPLPLDHRTAKALDDLNRMPVTPEQVAAGAVTPQTEGFLDAQINLARLRQAPQLVTEAIAARRDALTPGEAPTLPAAVARLDGQTIVAATLTAAAQAQYAERFVARLQPRYDQPAFRVAPGIEKEVLAADRWVRPDGAPASGGDLLDRALGNDGGTELRQVRELTRWVDVAQNDPVLAAVARERMTQLENLADKRQQGFINTQEALVQLRGEVEIAMPAPPLITAGDLATGLTASAHLPYNDPHGAGEPYRDWQKQTSTAQVQDLTPGPGLLAEGVDIEDRKNLHVGEPLGESLEIDERQPEQVETGPTTNSATPAAEVLATGRRANTGIEMGM